ncbi:MAG TPA: hypothetical protein VNM40_01560 [Candidatus Paceibacterota bacterium]|nr:hypothetical protein [Candidatus Paceibacterota bacterium]
MKDANNADKKDVLITALEERYEAMRTIRERVQSVGLWALGIMLAAAGWFVQSGTLIAPKQKLLYIIALGVAFWALRLKYLDDLEKGFSKQQRVAVRIEKALGLYAPGVFDEEEKSIYPQEWEKAGSEGGDGKFFAHTYLLLYIGITILVLAILLQPEYHTFFFSRWR